MLYFDVQFDNYEDFRKRFGYRTDENGSRLTNKNGKPQRLHSIVYQYWKTYIIFTQQHSSTIPFKQIIMDAPRIDNPIDVYYNMLRSLLCNRVDIGYLELNSVISQRYKIEPQDYKSDLISYIDYSTGKRIQIKLGKYLQLVFNNFKTYKTDIFWLQNPVLVTFFIETMCQQWNTKILSVKSLHLVVDKDFAGIYSTQRRWYDSRDFRSCMDDDPNWQFYAKRPDIFSAVSLQDQDGTIFARCLLVNCKEINSNTEYKLLERIYFNKQIYANQLLKLAKEQNIYDLIKNPGASCRDCCAISEKDGTYFRSYLYIPLDLHREDILSYQDTFKYYYPDLHRAVNCVNQARSYYSLASTNIHYRP